VVVPRRRPRPDEKPIPETRSLALRRQATLLSLISAFGSGLYLYTVKHRTGVIDREIGQAIQATQAAQAQAGLLRAEWSSLNDPERLQTLATHYLSLHPVAPTQFAQLAALPDRIDHAAAAPIPPRPAIAPEPAPTPAPDTRGTNLATAEPAPDEAAPMPELPQPARLRAPSALPSHPNSEHAPVITVAAAPRVRPPPRHITLARAEQPKAQTTSPYHHIGQARSDPPHDLARPQGSPLPLAAPAAPARIGAIYRDAMANPARPPPLPPMIAARPSTPIAAPYRPPGWAPYGYADGTPYAAMPTPRTSLPPPVPLDPAYQ